MSVSVERVQVPGTASRDWADLSDVPAPGAGALTAETAAALL